ncbi:MAG: ATP-binding cassette domain-containing protein [Alphaproteobacteria bacterium]|nr:ATP-binding cassette domain-containing protein [Alphaproteobacteria bacterium]
MNARGNGSGNGPAPNGSTGAPVIRMRDVHKAFGPKKVLQGIDLDVGERESVVIIGGSGTGKSVTLKCILGLLEPDKGSIKVDGEEVVGLTGQARDRINAKFGMLFQGAALFDSLSIWENVAFGLIQGRGMGRAEAKKVAIEKMGMVGLGKHVADLFPAEMSVGMQKRAGLARAIAADPEIVFFDEPTTGLDPIMADVINELIVHVVKDVGCSALTITHDMASARKIANRVAMLYEGRIIWAGPVDQIDRSGNEYLDQFIHGRPEGPIQLQVRAL